MTKREYKAVLRAVIRANYSWINPAFYSLCDFGRDEFDISLHRLYDLPTERRTADEYREFKRPVCDSFRHFWNYRRLFVDKLAALFAAFDEFAGADSYANDCFMIKYLYSGMRGGGWKYSETVEEVTPERFATEEERAAFELFARCLHGVIIDLYWEYGVYLSEYTQQRRTA